VPEVWTGFHVLTADECRRLLASKRIGRLALTVDALPCVLPVQYEMVGGGLLLRTPGHHEVRAGLDGEVVGFEADDLDLDHGTGWSVSVTGTVHVVDVPGTVDHLHPWFSDGIALALDAQLVSGHRVAT